MTFHAMTHRAMTHVSAHMAHHILACHLGAWRFLFLSAGAWRFLFLRTGDVAYQQEGGSDQYQFGFHVRSPQPRSLREWSYGECRQVFNSGSDQELPPPIDLTLSFLF